MSFFLTFFFSKRRQAAAPHKARFKLSLKKNTADPHLFKATFRLLHSVAIKEKPSCGGESRGWGGKGEGADRMTRSPRDRVTA